MFQNFTSHPRYFESVSAFFDSLSGPLVELRVPIFGASIRGLRKLQLHFASAPLDAETQDFPGRREARDKLKSIVLQPEAGKTEDGCLPQAAERGRGRASGK